MTELLWQSTLLVAVAFFFGAVFACGLKRRYYYGPSTKASTVAVSGVTHAPSADQPKIEVASRAVPEGERFERAISGQSASTAAAMAAPIAAGPKRAAPPPQPAPAPTPAAAAVPAPTPAAPPPAPPISSISVATGSGAPVKPEAGGAGPSDELTRIRGIDSIVQKQLRELGIRRFTDIAALTAADVKGLNDKLGVKGRIEQENWLGQAQILATGGETYYSRRVDRGLPVPEFAEPASLAPAATAVPPPAKPAETSTLPRTSSARGPSDDLTRIRGIDSAVQSQLNELGVRHFQELASLNGADVKVLSDRLGIGDRIEQENWLGQAQILATGGETYYARRLGGSAGTAAGTFACSGRGISRAGASGDSVRHGLPAIGALRSTGRLGDGSPDASRQRHRRLEAHPRHRRADREEAQFARHYPLRAGRQLDRRRH